MVNVVKLGPRSYEVLVGEWRGSFSASRRAQAFARGLRAGKLGKTTPCTLCQRNRSEVRRRSRALVSAVRLTLALRGRALEFKYLLRLSRLARTKTWRDYLCTKCAFRLASYIVEADVAYYKLAGEIIK